MSSSDALASTALSGPIPVWSNHDPLSVSSLLCNWARKSDSALFDLLDSLESRAGLDEASRRTKLFQFFTAQQRQLSALFALIRWLAENAPFLDRLRGLQAVLDRRQGLFEHTCETTAILLRRVEDRLYPMWDVQTALHVMASGTYRLLPRVIETRLLEEHQRAVQAGQATGQNPLQPPLSEKTIEETTQRLNNQLHIQLLSTPLPAALTRIDIRDGIAYLTFGDEFEMGVSLRMGPAEDDANGADGAAASEDSEASRINWRLFHLKILMNIDPHSSIGSDPHTAPPPLFNDQQLLHLVVLLNHISFEQPNPLLIFYDTLHSLLLGILMDVLHSQSVHLTKQFGMQDTHVEYAQASRILNVKYWRDLADMPVEGALTMLQTPQQQLQRAGDTPKRKESPVSPCLQILLDDQNRLSIRHNPPLPPSAEFPHLFSLNLSALSLTHVIGNVLQYHGNLRVEQLYRLLERESRDKGRKLIGAMEFEVIQRTTTVAVDATAQSGIDAIASQLQSLSIAPQSIVPRHSLLIRLLPGYTLSIHTDTQSGRFVLEWASSTDFSSGPSNLASFVASPQSHLNGILHAENSRLNAHIGSIFDIVLHIRMLCLTLQLAAATTQKCNPRHRVFLTHAPFNVQPSAARSGSAGALIVKYAKHIVYDPAHFKQYSGLPGANNDLFSRSGFGPYTVFLQLAGFSTQWFFVLQLNPFAQLMPACYLVNVEADTASGKAASTTVPRPSHSFGSIRQLLVIQWPALPPPSDPSIGFSTAQHPLALRSLLHEVEASVPLYTISRHLQSRFPTLITNGHVVSRSVPPSKLKLGAQLEDILQQRKDALKSSHAGITEGLIMPYLILELPFPLLHTMHNPANASMDLKPSDNIANLLVFSTTGSAGGHRQSPSQFAGGFVVHMSHPLLPLLRQSLSTLHADSVSHWHRLKDEVGPSAFAHGSDVLTLSYDNITLAHVSRLIYDLDNLYLHMSWLSNFIQAEAKPAPTALPAPMSSGMDEVIEHDAATSNGVQHSAHIKATSLSPTYFPPHFFRCTKFDCNQLIFAYVNPSSSKDQHPLCSVTIQRDHHAAAWQTKRMTQAQLWTSSGTPPATPPVPDLTEYRITLHPHAWPQQSFYAVDFNSHRPNNVLMLLHHVWVAHRSAPAIASFVSDVQRWQAMADLTSNHQLMRLHGAHAGAMMHVVAESATRIRLLFGVQATARSAGSNMWRCKTDLRLLYEGEVVQDFRAGQRVNVPAAGADSQQSNDTPQQTPPSHELIKAGKIGGDITQYLHQWLKSVATEEFKSTLRTLKQESAKTALLAGAQLDLHSPNDGNLAVPPLKLSFVASEGGQLDALEQQSLSLYFTQRFCCAPFIADPLSTLYRLLSAPPSAAEATLQCLRQLIGAFTLELLQPLQFPQPFPLTANVAPLRGVLKSLPPGVSPLVFRFVLLHRSPFELSFAADTRMVSFTIEVTEARMLAADSHIRPFSLYLPLAYHLDSGVLSRWFVPQRAHSAVKQFQPLPTTQPSLSSAFPSLAAAVQSLLACSLQQLADCCSAPSTGSAAVQNGVHKMENGHSGVADFLSVPIKKEEMGMQLSPVHSPPQTIL